MTEIDVAFMLTKDQRSRTIHTEGSSLDTKIYLKNSFQNMSESCEQVPLSTFSSTKSRCYCRQNIYGRRIRGFRYAGITKYAIFGILSMLLFLVSGQDIVLSDNDNDNDNDNDTHALHISNSSSLNLNINRNFNQSEFGREMDQARQGNGIGNGNGNASKLLPNSNEQWNRNSRIGIGNSKGEKLSDAIAGINGVSMNRNNLIDGDNTLLRQLREKAKQDSLQSIKMHILMRLNLKKLPNITKPIPVPQNILENFYKKYNASLLNSMWRHDKSPESTRASLYASGESAPNESTRPSIGSAKSHNSESPNNDDNTSSSSDNSSAEMQGDDPNVFEDYQLLYNIEYNGDQRPNFDNQRSRDYNINDNGDNGEYESILSHISSIYVFPEQPHVRHNRKTDVLRFKFDTVYSDISYVTLHLYLRGLDWIRANQPNIIEQIGDAQNDEIIVSVNRAFRRANGTSYTHKLKMFEFRHKIPKGLGQWVNVDLKPLFVTGTTMVGHEPNKTQEIFIKGVESWMKPLVVTTDSSSKNPLTVHIEIGSHKKHRRKRSVFLDCTESDHDLRCCRYPLKVNFTSFGWHFVVAPTSFDAYFCSGDCRVGYLEQYPHTHLAALTTSATPCCSPTKMSSLSLLYFDDNHNLVLSVIPNMSVEGCSCS